MNLLQEIKQNNPETQLLSKHPIAYFCAEFALEDGLPIYSGGLGVLAGDVVREADANSIPLVAIGLFYREGYFTQVISSSGEQHELPAFIKNITKLEEVKDEQGNTKFFNLQIDSRTIKIRVFKYSQGNTPVYLLDTDVEGNTESDRRLTLSLYPSDPEWRIQQEIILGIGGAKVLRELDITPSIYHLNEGHSAFAVLEITRQIMIDEKTNFEDALRKSCEKIVFTNHTLVASGNDAFHKDLVKNLLEEYSEATNIPIEKFVQMGQTPENPDFFSMTNLALSESKKSSAVSVSHGKYAKTLWPNHTLEAVTNGVFAPYWQQKGWQKHAHELQSGYEVPDEDLWETHQNYKHAMAQKISDETGRRFDPHVLTITWARRFAVYKQPMLIFSQIERLKKIVNHAERPVQILLAGKAHPSDMTAKAMIEQIIKIIETENLSDRIFFLPNYNLELAKSILSGSDVWLNTPEKGKEACGTSGMKSALNGVLQCAISDGWTDEVNLSDIGFSISEMDSSESLYRIIENDIAPMYYTKAEGHRPEHWCEKIRKTIMATYPAYTTERMMKQYFESLYLPVLKNNI